MDDVPWKLPQLFYFSVPNPHCLPKLPESTQRKQAIPNYVSLFYSHCGGVYMHVQPFFSDNTLCVVVYLCI
jgi:hypothetical protein